MRWRLNFELGKSLRLERLLRLRLHILDLPLLEDLAVLCDVAIHFFYNKSLATLLVQVSLGIDPLLKKKVLQKHDGLFLDIPLDAIKSFVDLHRSAS
jgi:hypothetical protein